MIFARALVSNQQAVDPVVLSLKDRLQEALPKDKLGALEVAVTEALTNIVRHAKRQEPDAPIEVEIVVADHEVQVIITDTGPPGPADLFEGVRPLEQIDPMEETGRGLALIQYFSDRMRFAPGAKGNRLELEFDRRSTP